MNIFRKKSKAVDASGIKHIAFIMDGNGRWATARMLPRAAGHRAGVNAMLKTIENCASLSISHVTFYAFSTENWNRPKEEIDALMGMFGEFLSERRKYLAEKNFRLRVLGDVSVLSADTAAAVREVTEESRHNSGLCINIAFNYGSRAEIVYAVNKLCQTGQPVTEQALSAALYTGGVPDPDIIVRTGGEMRLSNFLLFQAAYSELFFVNKYWPDFDVVALWDCTGV